MENNNPPTVIVQPSVVPISERIRMDSIFSVTDPDLNSVVTRYQFRDNGAGGGQILIGEEAIPVGQWREVSAQQLFRVKYQGATQFAQETYSVRAFDGIFWSNIGTTTITTGNETPVVNTRPGRVGASETIRIDKFFNVTDADNDPILRYSFVDRNTSANSGQFLLRGNPLNQGQFFTINAGELKDLTYRGAPNEGQVETIGVTATDGYSTSELAEFQMFTTSLTQITTTNETVLTNQRKFAGKFFDVFDDDGDGIFHYYVVDRRTNSNGGYWEYQGQRMQSGVWFGVPANMFSQLFYVGGTTGPQVENIGLQVYDGFQFSNVFNIQVKTLARPMVEGTDSAVKSTHYLNMLTGGTANTSGQMAPGNPILDLGTSGSEVEKLMFVDRKSNTNGGHFVFDGTRLPSAKWFTVDIEDLGLLEYRGGGFGFQSETVSAMSFSNGVWSAPDTFRMDTLKNNFRPVVDLLEVKARLGVVMNLSGMFTWSDQDGDILKSVHVYDTGDDPNSGYFSINGVRQAANVWINIPFEDVPAVRYHVADAANTEKIRMYVNDGRLVSTIATATVTAVDTPVIDASDNDISVNTIERVSAGSLIDQLDGGPAFTQYQVYDENAFFRSGRLELDGNDLQQGVVHTLTSAQFDRMVFKGAEVDFGRQLDPMLIRATNGVTGWSEWERVNVNTDPVGNRALISGTSITKKNAGPKTQITYTFIDGGNQSGGSRAAPNYPPLPSYYPPNATCDAPLGLEALQTRAFSQPQRESVREVLANYETYANVDFVEVEYTLAAANAEITFGSWGTFDCGVAGAAAYAFLPGSGNGLGNPESDIWFDWTIADWDPLTATDVSLGSSFRATAAHEVGHAVGFKHPFQGEPFLSIFNNYDYNSIMAYEHDNEHNPYDPYPEETSSMMLYDIVELQRLYGVNTEYNDNNNHYGNGFSGSYPHFVSNNESHQTTLYDSGGTDTLNYSVHIADETIDLREGTWSSINGVPQSLRISYLTTMENARGGSGNDNIRGNEISNLLFGNDGNDTLRGGGDNDVLRGGRGADIYQWSLGDGRDNIREERNGLVTLPGEDPEIDVLEMYDPSGGVDTLRDFVFSAPNGRKDLRIDLTYDTGDGQGTVFISDFITKTSQVELMRIHGLLGTQIGNAIDLISIYDQASNIPQQFRLTDNLGQNGGYIAVPV